LQQGTVIAAVRTEEDFCAALKTNINLIFDLNPDLLTLAERVKKAHQAGKKLLIHFDLATGIGKDKSGITFVKTTGAEGVISTRASVIKMAKELHLFTVQRFFILDSQSLHTTVETLHFDDVKAVGSLLCAMLLNLDLEALRCTFQN